MGGWAGPFQVQVGEEEGSGDTWKVKWPGVLVNQPNIGMHLEKSYESQVISQNQII